MISVELIGIQVDPVSGAAAVVLREHAAPNRLLPIIVGTNDAGSIAIAASGQRLPRPMPHDLMASLVESLDGHLDAVEVTALHDGAFLAELTVSGPAGQRRIDTRPSDGIALAVRLHAPLFVSEAVLDEAGALPIDEPETDHVAIEAAIDAEVDQFRAFLAELDPDDFIETTATEVGDSPAAVLDADHGEPADGEPADDEPVDGAPAEDEPADGAPSDGAPSNSGPADDEPSEGERPEVDAGDGEHPGDDRPDGDAAPADGATSPADPPEG